MKYLKTLLFPMSLFVVSTFSCSYNTNSVYEKELEAWREARIERLKSKTGWLNLAGLYWLKEGENTFGSDSSNSIIFPPNAKAFYGILQKTGDSILFKASENAEIKIKGEIVTEKNLDSDALGNPSLMESGSLAWFIIKRDGKSGIRLRDYNHPRIAKLDHIPYYETSVNWRIVADFIPFDSIRKIETATIIGGKEISNCPGELVFRKGLKKYRLLPFSGGEEFFIIFADKTNGIETYGNGRFLYSALPDSSNKVILDFNKAYNPPCAFSPFATCPMPPRENILDLRIEAGEKEVHF
jgi:uncharacterized protein (DUF1684 family)